VRPEWREAGARVSTLTHQALRKVIEDMLTTAFEICWQSLPTALMMWDRAIEKLAEKGITDPTNEQILETLEELADEIDLNASLASAPRPVRLAVLSALSLGKRFWKPEYAEKFTYEKLLEYARKHEPQVYEYMRKYPRLSRKIIEWVRACLMKS